MASGMHGGARSFLFKRANEFRKNLTESEYILWEFLKKKPLGLKFRRQHPYTNYVLDFYCHALKLVIEVDGEIHENEEVQRKDLERQNNIEQSGLIVKRIKSRRIVALRDEVFKELELLFGDLITKTKNQSPL